MSILDTTIVNVALRTLGHDLHSSISQIQWVVTGYLLSLAAVIPVTGWAARRFGAKRVYLTSLVLFTARLGAVRGRRLDDLAGLLPRPAGGGRRHDHAGRAADHGPGRRAQADGARDGHRLDARDARADPRAGRRRADPAEPALVVDLPRQRADRRDRVRRSAWRMLPQTDSGEAGPLDVLGLALLSAASTRSSTASPSSARTASLTAPSRRLADRRRRSS